MEPILLGAISLDLFARNPKNGLPHWVFAGFHSGRLVSGGEDPVREEGGAGAFRCTGAERLLGVKGSPKAKV